MDKIEKQIELKAPLARVWRALTDHQEFGTWFRVKVDAPFVPGEASRGHMTYPGYEHVQWAVVIQAMDSERLFSFTWHPHALDQSKDYSTEPSTLVEFRLAPTAGGTLLTLTESGFEGIPAERRFEAMRGNDNGWTTQMKNIAAHVEAQP